MLHVWVYYDVKINSSVPPGQKIVQYKKYVGTSGPWTFYVRVSRPREFNKIILCTGNKKLTSRTNVDKTITRNCKGYYAAMQRRVRSACQCTAMITTRYDNIIALGGRNKIILLYSAGSLYSVGYLDPQTICLLNYVYTKFVVAI